MRVSHQDYIYAIVEGNTRPHSRRLRQYGEWNPEGRAWLIAAATEAELARLEKLRLIVHRIKPTAAWEVRNLLMGRSLETVLNGGLQTEAQRAERHRCQDEYHQLRREAVIAERRRRQEIAREEDERLSRRLEEERHRLELRNAEFGSLEVACPYCGARATSDLLALNVSACEHVVEISSRRDMFQVGAHHHTELANISLGEHGHIKWRIRRLTEQGVPPDDADDLRVLTRSKDDLRLAALYARDPAAWVRWCLATLAQEAR